MGFPDFMLVGAARCGTSSLFLNLVQHPKILKPNYKEAHYFDNNFSRGDDWYINHFPETSDGQITFDATPNYIYHLECPRRINEYEKHYDLNLKFIVMLRNPIDRTWSHFEHCKHKVKITELTYDVRPENVFVIKSIYIDQLIRWREYFARDRFLFIRSEDFYADPRGVCRAVFRWLGVNEITLSKIRYWDPWKSNPLKYSKYNRCPAAVRKRLRRVFKPYNEKLYEYMDFDFGWK